MVSPPTTDFIRNHRGIRFIITEDYDIDMNDSEKIENFLVFSHFLQKTS